MSFRDLQLKEPLLRALDEEGYTAPTPIQVQAVPHALAGRDLLALAQTGTGKTAAFALPVLHRLTPPPATGRRPLRVLVLVPTRELAAQVGASFAAYGRHLPFRHAVVYGGVGQRPQTDAIARGVDVLVATPGRLLDLMGQRHVHLGDVEVFVLDEADRMLDMGFLPDVQRVIERLPKRRQTLFFSATMPRDAQALADRILVDPARVAVAPPATTVDLVDQSVCFVEKGEKAALLLRVLDDPAVARVLVFTRTRRGADRVTRQLADAGIRAAAIHADKTQGHRERALAAFREGKARVLVATDIAARGIDVEGVTHVVNYDVPNVPEAYVHRIGRTARAGASGAAIAFCDASERGFLHDIERAIRKRLKVLRPPRGDRGEGREAAVLDDARAPSEAAERPDDVPTPWTDPHAAPAPASSSPRPTGPRPAGGGYAPRRGTRGPAAQGPPQGPSRGARRQGRRGQGRRRG